MNATTNHKLDHVASPSTISSIILFTIYQQLDDENIRIEQCIISQSHDGDTKLVILNTHVDTHTKICVFKERDMSALFIFLMFICS